MRNRYEIFWAFFIPFVLALAMISLPSVLLPNSSDTHTYSDPYDIPLWSVIYMLLALGMLLLSVILPGYVVWRNPPDKSEVKFLNN